MSSRTTPQLSHFGVFCHDLDRMVAFYCEVFGMTVTDRGAGITMPFEIAFLSNSPTQHHQLALASRREGAISTVMQISFKVGVIDDLRAIRELALTRGASRMRGLNHGNALSIYFSDPEDNTVEVYLDTPWYVAQPHGDPLVLELADEEIWQETERICRADPTFMPVEQWRASFGRTGK
ncbi:VOC family protein [Paraburkholderia sp. HD33-4]|uniref:VOC family protein n=1 Tax=Paraburkholderia sp. HD33-4 TaxID=2883242 RepID=UPI001F470A38|nr:VOC family protein [Paraburkholderia sp. HD33-4]